MARQTTVAMGEATERVTFLTILKNRNFRSLWLGQIISQIGDYFAFLAMLVVVSGFSNDEQGTTLAVSGMMLAFTLPRLLFGLLAGVFVDRWDRRRTMLVSDVLRAALTLAMIPAFMEKNLLAVYALAFIMASVSTLFDPAKNALIPSLVPKEQLLSANSLSQTSMMLAVLVGPAIAGATLKLVGPGNEWVAFVVDSLSFVVSAFSIWLISVPRDRAGAHVEGGLEANAQSSSARQVWSELLVGLKLLVLNRTISLITSIAGITMLGVGAVNVLWIVYLKDHFGFESSELAWRLSLCDIAFALGMIGVSMIVGNFLSHVAPKWFIAVSLLGVGMSLIGLMLLNDYWLFLAGNAVLGAFIAPIETGIGTLVQIAVPNEQLGRANGGISTVSNTASAASMGLAGALGAALGIPLVFVISGLICMVMGVTAWALLPAISGKDKDSRETTGHSLTLSIHPENVPDPQAPLIEIESR